MRETIKYKGIELVVDFDYQPYEKQTLEHPGSREEVMANEIIHNGENICDILSYKAITEIEELTLEKYKEIDI